MSDTDIIAIPLTADKRICVEVTVTAEPVSARLTGPPEACSPAEPIEFEFVDEKYVQRIAGVVGLSLEDMYERAREVLEDESQ